MDSVKQKLFEKLDWHPWPTQREGHERTERFKSIFAGARYGKSRWAAMEVLPDILKEGSRGWIVAPTYSLASKEFAYIHEMLCMKLGFKPKKELNVRYTTPGPQMLLFPWGSEVLTKSEDNPDSLLGEELDWLILSEASRLKEETYDMYLRARLGTRMGRVIIPTTPHGYNWIYKRFYLPATEGKQGYWAKIVSVLENENFSREEYETAREELPEEVFEEQYNGQFVAWTGLIYNRFRRDKNVIRPFEIPPAWVRRMSIDPHPQTPCAVLWSAIDPNGSWFLYDELFEPNMTIPDVVRRIKEKEQKTQIYRRLIDPNAKFIDKLRGQIASIQQQFRKEGIYCVEANNKFESAYYKINELLTPRATYGNSQYKSPNLFVFSGLKETIHEFETCTFENEKDNHMLDCYSEDTEVLTQYGWLYIKDVNNWTPVATLNKEGNMEWQQPTNKIHRPYSGEMIRIKVKSSDYLVTPNHRMFVIPGQKSPDFPPLFKKAKDLSIWDKIPLMSGWKGKDPNYISIDPYHTSWRAGGGSNIERKWPEIKIDPELFYSFLGWYLSEGCCVKNRKIRQQWLISISQTKIIHPEKYDSIKALLKKLPWHFHSHEHGFGIQSRQLWEYLNREFGSDCKKKRLPAKYKAVSKDLLDLLWGSFVLGDGWKQRGRSSVASTSRRLIDDLQEVCLKRGTRLNITEKRGQSLAVDGRQIFKSSDLFVGYECINKFLFLRDYKNNPKFNCESYNGYVSCLTVPNGTLYIRRNGNPMWCGNCLKYMANDHYMKTWKEEEIRAIEQREDEYLRGMNARTGY